MKKIINGSKIEFYDDYDNEVMYIDYLYDECIWYFNSDEVITITQDMELYKLIIELMSQNYIFDDNAVLKNYKDNDYFKWYSDCYYNPNDEWSYKNVSYLNIKKEQNCFKLWCVKPLDEIINRKKKNYVIAFSPLGNGNYSKNILTGLTLQDDFVLSVYQKLININKTRKLSKNR